MNVYMISSGYNGCNYVRIFLPGVHNGYTMNKYSLSSPPDAPELMKKRLEIADVVVFHRPETDNHYDLAKELKDNGKIIVVDNDDTFKLDDFYKLAEFSADGIGVNLKKRDDAMDKILGIADLVTTTTDFLANEYRKKNNNVVVLQNCVDELDWSTPKRNKSNKVRIGMVGSVAYEYDYLHIKDVLRKLSDRKDVELVLFGLGDKKHKKNNPAVTKAFKDEYTFWDSINKEQIPWCDTQDYPTLLNNAELDIMLIPRKDNYFNRCKSNLKFLEAAMCEIPVIAQSFEDGPYEEIEYGKTGILINDNDDWLDSINHLINNKAIRREIGKNAKKYVLNNYNISDRAQNWETAYKKVYENRSKK